MILVAKRVAGGDILDADDRRDVAGVAGVDVFAFVGLNLDQTRLMRSRLFVRGL